MNQDEKATRALQSLLYHVARTATAQGLDRREAAYAAADAAADLAEALDSGGYPSVMTYTRDGVRLDPGGEKSRWIKVPAQKERAS